jgi:hypothetical protein
MARASSHDALLDAHCFWRVEQTVIPLLPVCKRRPPNRALVTSGTPFELLILKNPNSLLPLSSPPRYSKIHFLCTFCCDSHSWMAP